jgi:hypothetical protein
MKLRNYLAHIPDVRRREGRRFDLPNILLFTLLAVISGADSYRSMARFMQARLCWFKQLTGCDWKTAPSVTGLRKLLLGMDQQAVEKALRDHAQEADPDAALIAIDGKTLRGSVDHAADSAALQWVSAFSTLGKITLGQVELADGDKGGEIAAAQQLIDSLGVTGKIFTLDALHCQKNA